MSAAYSSPPASSKPTSPGAKVPFSLQNGHHQSMDSRSGDYQSSEQQNTPPYPPAQDPRHSNFSASTPASDYPLPSSARSGTFPEFVNQRQHYSPSQAPSQGAMAQPPSPSYHQTHGLNKNSRSNRELPIDPSIAASPTYPPPSHYPQYQTQPDMYSAGHPGVYGRPDWAGGQYQQPPTPMGHYPHSVTSGPPSAGLVSPVSPYARHYPVHPNTPQGGISTVYSFVPIPGAQQHKRPRRRYEEIERMYKCGWNGCEKAYGTLNHLNAHVTMQSHGNKRTPEEFKEIRKEWKQKKKEEEAQRKASEERQRAQDDPVRNQGQGPPQLPPLGYATSGAPPTPGYGAPSPAIEGMSNYPTSPYGPNHSIYPSR